MLGRSAAYTKNSATGAVSNDSLMSLSQPKPQRMHSENQQCLELGLRDHIDYAKYKADQLHQSRLEEEARLKTELIERKLKEESMHAFKALKKQVSLP